jgi:hypothetical protein
MRNKNIKAGLLSEKKILIYILFIAVLMRCFSLMVFMYTKNYAIKDIGNPCKILSEDKKRGEKNDYV